MLRCLSICVVFMLLFFSHADSVVRRSSTHHMQPYFDFSFAILVCLTTKLYELYPYIQQIAYSVRINLHITRDRCRLTRLLSDPSPSVSDPSDPSPLATRPD